jgi:hypothetical protein
MWDSVRISRRIAAKFPVIMLLRLVGSNLVTSGGSGVVSCGVVSCGVVSCGVVSCVLSLGEVKLVKALPSIFR